MTTLIIQRTKTIFGGRQAYKIWLDGKLASKIKNGETIKIDVPAGTHTIQTGINKFTGLSKIESFEAIDEKTIEYTINKPHLSNILFIIIFLLAAAAGINIHTGSYIIVLILLVLVLALIFLMSKFLIYLKRIL